MAIRSDPRVDAYIKQAAPFAQPILKHLRQLVRQGCPEVTETIKWGMPSFTVDGKILCGMAAFKAHCTFGFWHQAMEKIIAKAHGTIGDAMGLMGRITSLADLPVDEAMLGYIKTAVSLNSSDQPARSRPAGKRKPEAAVPADLAAALKKNKTAAATFAKFTPSHRREYVEWITEAKREETRQKRLATTLEWLAEGKSRHWKYANC